MPTFPRLGSSKHNSDRSQPPPPQSSNNLVVAADDGQSTLSQITLPSHNSSQSSFVAEHQLQQQQQQQQHQQHPAGGGARLPPKQAYSGNNSSSDVGSGIADSSSSFFTGRRHSEFDEAAIQRSQQQQPQSNNRFSYAPGALPQQQQQQVYTSVPVPSSHSIDEEAPANVAPPSAEKKSKRQFIKGIFSGSSRLGDSHQQQQQQQQQQLLSDQNLYDSNGSYIGRRLSKRDSAAAQRLQQQQQQQQQQQPGYSLESSPLHDVGEIDEYQIIDNSSRSETTDFGPQSQTVRPVTADSQSYEQQQQGGGAYHQQHHAGPASGLEGAGQTIGVTHLQQQQQHQQQGQLQGQGLSIVPSQPQPHLQQQQAQPTANATPLAPQPQAQGQQLQHPNSHQHQQQQNDPQQQQRYSIQGQPPPSYTFNSSVSHQSLSQGQNPDTLGASRDSLLTDPDQLSTSQHSSIQQQSSQDPAATQSPAMSSSTQGLTRGGEKGSVRGQQGGAAAQIPRFDRTSTDIGRQSPQPEAPAEGDKNFKDLLAKYKNVKRLYFERMATIDSLNGKVDGLNGQVEQLQDAVANQRITHSRTALDDNEYTARSNRLNGAIMNLAFNIRKDWKSLPPWLAGKVSADALKTGKQEMTAVGRATISRWLAEELFEKCFHPGLDEALSSELKSIELSIRGNAYTMHSQEEFDALTTKVVNWRMATLDGLQTKLTPDLIDKNKQALMASTTKSLTSYLYKFLNDPPPPGVDGSTSTIAELAVSIAANLPLESRDVAITYPLPGDILRPNIMEVEKTELPPVDDGNSDDDSDEDGKGASKDVKRVRFAGFMAWEVRGRQVLMPAPVWVM